jgi:flagellar basal-body rod protein FlgG
MSYGRDVSEIYTYFTAGEMVQTDNKLDFSIQNADTAFFTVGVKDANGNIKNYYTRDGAFLIDANKQLTTKNGRLVIGNKGPIKLNSDNVIIERDGSIYENEQFIDKLAVVNFTNARNLRKQGDNLFLPVEQGGTSAFNGEVLQGFIEKANVNVVTEMVEMISVLRSFELSQKMIQANDTTLQKAANEIGVVK